MKSNNKSLWLNFCSWRDFNSRIFFFNLGNYLSFYSSHPSQYGALFKWPSCHMGWPLNISIYILRLCSIVHLFVCLLNHFSHSNGFTYFFKGAQYYRFNPRTLRVDPGYPRSVSSYWNGLPSDIEGALQWYNGGVFAFKDTQHWLFVHSEQSISVPSSYPESITQWWSSEPDFADYTVFRSVSLIKKCLEQSASHVCITFALWFILQWTCNKFVIDS